MNAYRQVVEALSFLPGVRGAVVAAADGVVVESVVHADVRPEIVAAFGNAVYRAAASIAHASLNDTPRYVAVDGAQGRLCLTGNDEVTVVVLVEPRTATGRLRIALHQAMGALV
jgi:predicted regulator of Ras-like GTPase activity (Roadblock/LC7/MglB family)